MALAAAAGVAGGTASFAFLHALRWATNARLAHDWPLWLLPSIGLAIGSAYHWFGAGAQTGTPLVIDVARGADRPIPLRMTALIFGAATLGHLSGASVGREGVALQMSGSLADSFGRSVHLGHRDRQVLVASSLAAAFGGMFGVPVSGVVFALTISHLCRPLAVLCAGIGAASAYATVELLGWEHFHYPTLPTVNWTLGLPLALAVCGVVLGLLGRLYLSSLDRVRHILARPIWPPLRPVIGALATIGLAALVGRDYLGLSFGLAEAALAGLPVDWWDPLLKLTFTVLALGFGFHGGELIPLMVVGATASSVIADWLGAPTAVMVAAGFAAVFASSAHTAVAGVVIAVELFGCQALAPALIVTGAARLLAQPHTLFDLRPTSEPSATSLG
jgi:H+/Cl- antiporter ClcA